MVPARVKHLSRVIKRQFGHVKTRYRGTGQEPRPALHPIRARQGSDDVTARRRHRCANVGLRRSTKENGYFGDYHGRARPGEECVPDGQR